MTQTIQTFGFVFLALLEISWWLLGEIAGWILLFGLTLSPFLVEWLGIPPLALVAIAAVLLVANVTNKA